MRGSTRVLAGVAAALSLLAAACGGSDDGGGSTMGTVDESLRSGVAAGMQADQTNAAAVEQPTTMEEWEALWEEERAAIVARIEESGWGKNAAGTEVTGPEGYRIDLTKCPAAWSDTEGLTDTEIKIGQTIALSGPAADYGNIARAMVPVYDRLSAEGFFTDSLGKNRRINYITRDDGFDAARTIPLVDELIDSEKVFTVWTMGSPGSIKTYDKLNERCIPQALAMSAHPSLGDPVNHPWTTGQQLALHTEGLLWGGFIEEHIDEFPDGLTVASLVVDNDLGNTWDAAFQSWLAESPIKDKVEYVTESFDPAAPTVKDPMTTLASQNPDIFINMSVGTPCTQAIVEAAENGMKESVRYKFLPSPCAASSFVSAKAVGGDGSASHDWWIINGGAKDLNDPSQFDDPYVAWARQVLQEAGIDPAASGSLGYGIYYAWPMSQVLKIAGELDGGLTRTNLMVALRSFDMTHPFLLPGIGFNLNGNKDAYLIEGGVFQTYDSTRQGWVSQGGVLDFSGQSKPCAWNTSTGSCG